MGRRSINTTKSGKFMNPTDRARKEARRKELRKNKKQRNAVRQAVLKSKDASILLEEASLYDKQEYDPKSASTLNERVLQEKRKKLMETYDRMLILYKKEDPEKAAELQTMKDEYDRKRNDMIMYYDQVKLTEKVKTTEIPLPECPPQNLANLPQYPSDIPLPPVMNIPPHPSVLAAAAMTSAIVPAKSILKKSESSSVVPGPPPGLPTLHKKPVAPPPGSPDDLSDASSISSSSDDYSEEDNSESNDNKSSDSDDDEGNDENETKIKTEKRLRFSENNEDLSNSNSTVERNSQVSGIPVPVSQVIPPNMIPTMAPITNIPGPFLHPANIPVPTGLPPPPIPIMGAPGLHPNANSIAVPPQMFSGVMNQKARPNYPPKNLSDIPLPPQASSATTATAISTIQSNIKKPGLQQNAGKTGSTIEAKPQLKNLIGDSTKLVPTSLKLRKMRPITVQQSTQLKIQNNVMKDYRPTNQNTGPVTSKDDAYDLFMKEMEGLL